jgi:hypothetical protein
LSILIDAGKSVRSSWESASLDGTSRRMELDVCAYAVDSPFVPPRDRGVAGFPLTVSNTAVVAGHRIIIAAWRFVTARRDAAAKS